MITFETHGSFKNTEAFLQAMIKDQLFKNLDALAQQGVAALSSATPKESGLTASSWKYEIDISSTSCSITWLNTNIVNGFPVAVGLQYGHGTGTGGYVSGFDYINPAIRPIFDRIADQVWREVTSA